MRQPTKPKTIENHCNTLKKLMKKCEECARRSFSKGSPSHCHHELLYKGLEEAFGAERPRDEVRKDPGRDHEFTLKRMRDLFGKPLLAMQEVARRTARRLSRRDGVNAAYWILWTP